MICYSRGTLEGVGSGRKTPGQRHRQPQRPTTTFFPSMSSRFFRAISDSESDSSEEEELLSDEEQTQVKSSTKKGGDSDEDSDEDEDEDLSLIHI